MKIGELAASLGVTPRTIRFYEDEGLLTSRRSAGGTRYYRALDVQRLRAIHALVMAGFSLEAIKGLAAERERHATGHRACLGVERHLEALETECQVRLQAVQAAMTELQAARLLVAGCHGCRRRPDSAHCPDCPVKAERLRSSMAGLVWDQAD